MIDHLYSELIQDNTFTKQIHSIWSSSNCEKLPFRHKESPAAWQSDYWFTTHDDERPFIFASSMCVYVILCILDVTASHYTIYLRHHYM